MGHSRQMNGYGANKTIIQVSH